MEANVTLNSLASYTVTVACTRTAFSEGGVTVNIDVIVATACNQPASGNCPNATPDKNYVERKITIDVGQP